MMAGATGFARPISRAWPNGLYSMEPERLTEPFSSAAISARRLVGRHLSETASSARSVSRRWLSI